MQKNWHSFPVKEIFRQIKSGPSGLTASQAAKRLKEAGRNMLPQEKPYSKLRLFLHQFNSPLMYILFTTVLISFFLRHYTDTIFIIIVLFINTTVGFYQENKANKSLLALKKMVKIKAHVLREGNEKEIDSEELVAGDVVILKVGDKIPADGRLFEIKGLKINEANLTGEWQLVEKNLAELPEETPLSDRTNMVFMGTIAEEGEGKMVVTSTGSKTQFGEVVALLKRTRERKTPLQKRILSLSKLTGAFIVLVIFLIIIIGYFTEKSFADIFVASLALAVSAIPEGLLPAITVILVLGMRRILKQNGLVRKLIATETLGNVSVICTDKTGTLTEAKMQVSQILTSTRELMRDGIDGLAKGDKINGIESHILALKIATLANDAFVENPEAGLEEWIMRGRPTERALLLAGMQAGLSKKELEKQYPVVDRIGFDSDLKYAASLHEINKGKREFYIIGAPEDIIAQSIDLDVDGKREKISSAQANKLMEKFEELTQKGLRVVACAYRCLKGKLNYQDIRELADKLTLVGFIALKDPIRQDAREVLEITKKAGVRTIIVTGDHKLTAKAVAGEVGFDTRDENIIEGKDLEMISDKELEEEARHISIYARVSPHHKMRIIDALQANGEVVAMLGDGVNDAPALKSADIGVTIGSGSDVAKEVSDLVLLNDSFKTIVKAIEQGRVIFNNIRKVFVYLVADDFSEIFLFLGTMIMGLPLPLLPAQILWINLVEDGLPSIALTTEQETKGVMQEKPRDPKESIINKPIRLWMTSILFVTGIALFLFFFILWRITYDLEKTRTMVFALMCFDSLLFAFCVRSFKRSVFRRDIFSNRYLVGATVIGLLLLAGAIYLPFLQKILGTQALNIAEWLIILAIAGAEILLLEFFKRKFFTKSAR